MKRVYEWDEQGRKYCQPAFWQEEPMEITLTTPIDMTDADSLRKEMKKEHEIHISISPMIIKAVAGALENFPIIGGRWLAKDKIWVPDPDETYIFYPIRVEDSIGIGLIEKANRKSLLEISKELNTQVDEVRSKGIDVLIDMPENFPPKRPFLDIVNLGAIGSLESSSVGRFSPLSITTAVLGVCTMSEKAVVKDGQIQIRKMMNMILIFDHRAMNPNTPMEFLNQLKRNLEEPATYLV